MHRAAAALWLPRLVVAVAVSAPGAAAPPLALKPGEKLLFLDDLGVESMTGLVRAFHTPVKRGPVLKADIPSDGRYIAVVSAPMWIPEEALYRVVYEARHQPRGGAPYERYALARSRDGVRWEKPSLGLMEFAGSKENNHFPTPGGKRLWHVVHDPDDPAPERRYKGLVREEGEGHLAAASPDGLHWRIIEGAPLLRSSDAGTLTYDRPRRRFLAVLKFLGRYGRSYNLFESRDFVHWEGPRFLFSADAKDQELALEAIRRRLANPALARPLSVAPDPALGWPSPAPDSGAPAVWNAQIYNMGIFPYEGLYLGWFQVYYPTGLVLPQRRNTDGFNLVQLAMSRDLRSWHRLGSRETFIGPSRLDQGLVGNYDRVQLGVTNRPVEHATELHFYYEGMKHRSVPYDRYVDGTPRDPATLTDLERADGLDDTLSALHLAVLRRDGFVSLDAGAAAGSLVTRPLRITGTELHLNLAAPGGSAHVEILGEDGTPLAGFGPADALPVTGDSVGAPVAWRSGRPLAELAGKVLRLRVHLRDARLYAVGAR